MREMTWYAITRRFKDLKYTKLVLLIQGILVLKILDHLTMIFFTIGELNNKHQLTKQMDLELLKLV